MKVNGIKGAIEAIMFLWGEPVEIGDLADLFSIDAETITKSIEELKEEYDRGDGGLTIRKINKSYQLVTKPIYDELIQQFCTPVKMKKLSQSALEVLAIVAYKQPVTKGEIDSIRGIKCDRVIEGLLKKGLVRERGRSKAIGKPILYGTTDEFLKNFGFESLKDLPAIEEIDRLIGVDDMDEEGNRQLRLNLEEDEDVEKSEGLQIDEIDQLSRERNEDAMEEE